MTDDIDQQVLTDDNLAAMLADAAPEATPGPEPEASDEVAPPPPRQETQHVPLADLMEERGRRKEAQARMDEMERRFAEFQARAQAMLQQQQQPPQPPVNYDDDPIEYLRQQQAQVAANLQALAQQQHQTVQQQQAERHWQAMREAVGQAEAAFAAKQTDYWDAVNHLKATRQQQLLSQGLSEQQAAAMIQQDAIAVATEAGRLGLSPAEYAYRIAVGTGYAPRAAKAAAAAQEAPRSLGGASGRADAATPSLADISRMSDKDFDKVFAKMMGGT